MSTLSREKAEKARLRGAGEEAGSWKQGARKGAGQGRARNERERDESDISVRAAKVRQGACAAGGAGIAIAERRSRLNFEAA